MLSCSHKYKISVVYSLLKITFRLSFIHEAPDEELHKINKNEFYFLKTHRPINEMQQIHNKTLK